MPETLKRWASVYWWIGIPAAALSFVTTIIGLLDSAGLNSRQFLDIVYSITIRWDFWLAKAFEGIEFVLPFEPHISQEDRHAITVLVSFIIPMQISIVEISFRSKSWILGVIHLLLTLSFIWFCIGIMSVGHASDEGAGAIVVICLVGGIIGTYFFRRKYFLALAFAVSVLLSVELIRFVPTAQPSIDRLQQWLEDVPVDYADPPESEGSA